LSGARKALSVVGVLVVVLVAAVAGGALFLRNLGVLGSSAPGEKVSFVIPKGYSAQDIGRLLESKGVIASALGWRLTTTLEGGAENIQAGRYEIRRGLVPRDALGRLLARGPDVGFTTVTFKEGWWLEDFGGALEDATDISGERFVRLARGGHISSSLLPPGEQSLEGLLFPSTYQVTKGTTARTLVRRLVTEAEERVSGLDLTEVKAKGVSPYQTVIVASMIEAEAKAPGDRAKIAAVIYNRLARGMPLGIDATVAYAVGDRSGGLTESELAVDSPYNTRKVTGLPPTPIGAPGMASLEAAAAPAGGGWLYYVVGDCAGHHSFSETYDEFLSDKADYQALAC